MQKYEKEMPLLPTHTAADYAHKVVAKNKLLTIWSGPGLDSSRNSETGRVPRVPKVSLVPVLLKPAGIHTPINSDINGK